MPGGIAKIGGWVDSQIGAVMNTPTAIADVLAVGAGDAVGEAMGVAGAAVGAVKGAIAMCEGSHQMMAEVATQTVTDLVTFTLETLTNNLTKVITPPSMDDIMGYAGDAMNKYVNETNKEELKNLLVDKEKIAELKEKLSITNALGSVVGAMNDVVSQVTKKITDYCKIIGEKINEMKTHIAEGKDWLLDQIDKYSNEIKDCIEDFINDQTRALLVIKQRAIEGLGAAIGTGLGKAVCALMESKAKKVIDTAREKVQNVIIQAKAAISEALCALMAKIGG